MKNGDRWTVLHLIVLRACACGTSRAAASSTLPADYVSTAAEFGYATTVHTAQGVTADTMHGVVIGGESRQLLYTMLTRGRAANHVYVAVIGDGDPHTVIQPDNVHLRTATELLEQSWPVTRRRNPPPPCSASSTTRLSGSAGRPARYLDALHLAAEYLAGPQVVANLDRSAERLLSGLTGEPAWPTLRGHLLLLAAADADPVAELFIAAATRDLTSARDQAAVIDTRIRRRQ